MAVRGLALTLLGCLGACSFEVSYDGSHYACDPVTRACPSGLECSDQGFCVPPAGAADAGDTPDGAGLPADAAIGPDAPAPLILRFGERPLDEVKGVTEDTCVDDLFQPDNYGGDPTIFVRHQSNQTITGQLRFELSSIPPGATVLGASLELWTTSDALDSGDLQVFALAEAWNEGTGQEAPGTANWNDRQDGVPWSTPGALPPTDQAPLATFSPSAANMPFTVTLPASLVQSWIDAPAQNFGVLLVVADLGADVILESSESSRAGRRPQLTVVLAP